MATIVRNSITITSIDDGSASSNLFRDSARTRSSSRFLELLVYDILAKYIGMQVTVSFDGWINEEGTERNIQMYPYQNNGISIADSTTFAFKKVKQRFFLTTTVKDWGINNPAYSKGSIALYDNVGTNSFSIEKIMICLGTNVIWSSHPEDVNADLILLKAKTEGMTAIEGGVIYTNILSLQQLDGIQTAGISGIDEVNSQGRAFGELPAMWAGGTYNDAVSGLAKIILYHAGKAKIGQLYIDDSGTTQILDESGEALITLSDQRVLTEYQLESASQDSTTSGYNKTYTGNTTDTAVPLTPNIAVNNNNSTVTLNGNVNCAIVPGSETIASGQYSIFVTLYLESSSGVILPVRQFFHPALFNSDGYVDILYVSQNIKSTFTVEAGTYVLKMNCELINQSQTGDIVTTELTVTNISANVYFNANVKRNDFGKDGFILSRRKQDFFRAVINESSGNLEMTMKSSQALDMPGVLAAYSVASTNTGGTSGLGAIKTKYGNYTYNAIQGTAWTATGKCTIRHNIGHTNYFVQVQPTDSTSGRFISHNVTSKTTTSVTLEFARDNYYSCAFDIVFFGNNQ